MPSTVMNSYEKLFDTITQDPRYLENLDWGEPRSGHPEGSIRAHIAELDRNVEALRDRLTEDEYWKMRVLVHVHDAFKAEAKEGVPILDPRSHASLARAFLESFEVDPDLLAMVQFHDEPYALWLQLKSRYRYNEKRFTDLLAAIHDWNLFTAFLIVDGCTAGKSREPLQWFLAEIAGKVRSNFGEEDILGE